MAANSASQVVKPSINPNVSVSGIGQAAQYLQSRVDQQQASSAEQAAILRDWQAEQNRIAMEFSAAEAAKNRDWQEMMSNTAHQREIKDLMAAGLNPVLSAMGGNGAPVTSGATASGVTSAGAMGQTDMSLSGVLGSLLSALISSATQISNTNTSALSAMYGADKAAETSRYVADLSSQTQLTTATISRMATEFAARTGADATTASAAIHAAAQRYGYDVGSLTQKEITAFNAFVNQQLQDDSQAHDFDIRTAFPNNEWNFLGSLLRNYGGIEGIPDAMKDFVSYFFGSYAAGRNFANSGFDNYLHQGIDIA